MKDFLGLVGSILFLIFLAGIFVMAIWANISVFNQCRADGYSLAICLSDRYRVTSPSQP